MRNRWIMTLAMLGMLAGAAGVPGRAQDKPADDKAADKMPAEKMADDKMSDDKMSDGKMSDDKMSDDKMPADKMSRKKSRSITRTKWTRWRKKARPRTSAEELKLKKGDAVTVVIKSTEVMFQQD